MNEKQTIKEQRVTIDSLKFKLAERNNEIEWLKKEIVSLNNDVAAVTEQNIKLYLQIHRNEPEPELCTILLGGDKLAVLSDGRDVEVFKVVADSFPADVLSYLDDNNLRPSDEQLSNFPWLKAHFVTPTVPATCDGMVDVEVEIERWFNGTDRPTSYTANILNQPAEIKGCPMGRGASMVEAVKDLENRVRMESKVEIDIVETFKRF